MKIQLFLMTLQLMWAASYQDTIRSSTGKPIGDKTNSLTAGTRGPVLLQDVELIEDLARFDRERIPERVVHAKGSGAFGYFEVTDDITMYTKAKIFCEVGKQTPILVRFSLAAADRGGAETTRDVRGFAIKFYTEEGNWDLVGINFPIFFLRDSLLTSSLAHILKRNPVTNLHDKNAFWDFLTLRPESTHKLTHLFSDRGIPDGYRYMDGFGVNAFKLVNAKGQAVYCKFHIKSDQGIRNLSPEQGMELAGTDPDYAGRDLYRAIQDGHYPSWTLYIQVMTFKQAEEWYFNPFDATKVWPELEYPLIRVGKLVVNKLPNNFFAEVEQAGFCPANLVPGIEASPDKLLQGRLFSYSDTQRHRLGANFKQFPVNNPYRSSPRNYQRDGPQTVTDNQDGEVNYYPNSYGGPAEDPKYEESCFVSSGDVCRFNSTDEDNFTQAGIFYREVLKEDERTRLIQNIAQDLSFAEEFIQERAVKNFYQADEDYGLRVQEELKKMKQ